MTITEDQALALLRKHDLPEKRVLHSIVVAEFAHDLARTIREKHPDLPVDPRTVRIAALLHDIGRGRAGDHEINSIAILREEGLDDLAEIVSHGSIYEIMKLRGIDDPSLLPRTLENKIVSYADARCRLTVVTLRERTEELLRRRKDEAEKVAAVKMATLRFRRLERELMRLTS